MAKKSNPNTIAANRRARHDYLIEERYEAGVMLQGWEVKSLRLGKAQITESYVIVRNGEAWLLGAHISPIDSICTHITADPTRTRKLLLHKKELDTLIGKVERKGYTLVALTLYWKNNRVKLEVALGKGKKQHDKRASKKDQDWQRQQSRIIRDRG